MLSNHFLYIDLLACVGCLRFIRHTGFVPNTINETLHPWDKPVVKLKGTLRDKKNNRHPVELVPMGNTIFRRVTFSKANVN